MASSAASTSASTAREQRLDELVHALEARGDRMDLVRLVEAWSAEGSPTPRARLAEGRAFLNLRLMDRAMARAREVLDVEADDPAALLLLAEVFLERGWPVKARKPLATLRDAGGEVDALWARAHQDPVRPEANAREVEREGDPAKLLQLAEAFLATGSFLRATGILERLRRADPDHPRIRELLWGLAGDFGGPGLDALVATLAPAPAAPDALPEEPENTESVRLASAPLVPDDATEDASFPALFKYAPGRPRAEEPENTESTQTSGLASREQMASPPASADAPDVAAPLAEKPGGDTQIMLVLRPGEDLPRVTHRKRDEEDGLRDSLNLRAWQQSMGMTTPADSDLDAHHDDDLLEEEDENVVVMTRAEKQAGPSPEPPATFAKPIEVLEKHPVPLAYVEPPEPTVTADLPIPEPPSSPLRSPLLWAGVALALGAAAVAAVLFFLGALGAHTVGGDPVRDDLVRALARQDYDALLQQEGRLEQRVRAGDAAPEVAEGLTETRLVLWSDFNGDPARLAAVDAALGETAGHDPRRLAILRAELALAREDLPGATAAIAREVPEDDEERLLFARIAARSGDLSRAMAHFEEMERDAEPRYRLARAEALAGAGRDDDARAEVQAVLSSVPDHVGARLLALELQEGEPATVVASAEILLSSLKEKGLAPRLEGRAHAVRARALVAMGARQKAREAVAAGLARDGTNPDLLYLGAADLAAAGRLVDAARDLDTVAAARLGHARAQAARALVLLELDRVDEADALVKGLEDRRLLPELTPVLRALVSIWGNGERPPQPFASSPTLTPLQAYAQALLAVQEHDPAALAAVTAAREALAASPDPFEQRLAPRLFGLAAVAAPGPEAEALAKEAEAKAGEDAVAHVWLGRFYEGAGRRALAAQHFDRAVVLGPEVGLAWYEKGRFYSDARDRLGRTEEAWRSYLALAPTGARARRAGDKVGRP
ncbi:MAG: hypothetical protein ACOZNI_35210 [Myxococcota bacterium]